MELSKEVADEIDRLIRFLDETDNHRELEPEDEGDDSDTEPSLGSFDRMVDQSKSWASRDLMSAQFDAEQDDCDKEDADPAELSEPSGIGDHDGLAEQVGRQDWQPIFFV